MVDGLRCRETLASASRRDARLVEQRRIETEILAVTLVLDERGRIDDSLAARDGVDLRDRRARVETARAFDALADVASAAGAGLLSVEDTRRRYEARFLRTWWTGDRGMLEGRFALPDLQGAAFESVIHQITEQMRPAPWWAAPGRCIR